MSRERLRNQFRDLIGNPFNVIVLITLILLFTLIVIPLLSMLQNTFVVAKSELRNIPGARIGDYTLWYWKYLLASPLTKTILWVPLRNSLIIGAVVTGDEAVNATMNVIRATGIRLTLTVVVMLPIMLVYPFIQKFYVKGVMIGAVKG